MNSKRGAINFEVGGASYTARLSTNAMVKYQDATGENVLYAFSKLEGGSPDMKRLRNIFWACLGGDITKEETGDLMDDLGVTEVGRIISEAAVAAFPDAQKVSEPGKAKPGKKASPAAKT